MIIQGPFTDIFTSFSRMTISSACIYLNKDHFQTTGISGQTVYCIYRLRLHKNNSTATPILR